MKLLLANPRGFCAGVYMAIDVVEQLVEIYQGKLICVYHEIVHNKHVVDRFRRRGVRFVDSLEEVPVGSVVVFSAHGVSPALRRQAVERRLTAIDATCPLVTKVHMEAIRYATKGYQILLVGHADHQEIIGTTGEAPDAIQVVSSPQDIPQLHIEDPKKLVYLTQTTLGMDDAATIIEGLRKAFPHIKDPPSEDICYATTNRQKAVRAIAPECDLVLVVGSKNSSNSVRLTEIAEATGTRAYLIDDTSELEDHWFDGVENLLITAGASAPEDLVRELVLYLIDHHQGEVEQRDIFHESIEFGLPQTLKSFMRANGINPDGRRVVRDDAVALDRWLESQGIAHRTVDMTIGATA
ncbi:MAG: 4-hydroxy-3-methylbut-2-enyl diphosphate reductase [Planctomycetota bacterium]|jgi:4-hydroxy-3-methylbut-2-enyl diphosphate reductase